MILGFDINSRIIALAKTQNTATTTAMYIKPPIYRVRVSRICLRRAVVVQNVRRRVGDDDTRRARLISAPSFPPRDRPSRGQLSPAQVVAVYFGALVAILARTIIGVVTAQAIPSSSGPIPQRRRLLVFIVVVFLRARARLEKSLLSDPKSQYRNMPITFGASAGEFAKTS